MLAVLSVLLYLVRNYLSDLDQLLWGFSQPFVVYLAERSFGFGKMIFFTSILLGVGCFVMYASNTSSGVFIFGMGVIIGIAASGNPFPIVLASVARRFSQNSRYQSIAFGIVSSFGNFGQACFLPMARGLLTSVGWRLSMVVLGKDFLCNIASNVLTICLGAIMVAFSPLAYFLQTIPPKK